MNLLIGDFMLAGILLFCITYATVGAFCISIGYHRGLCHKSFRSPKWFDYLMVCAVIPTGHPIWWVAVHRAHHAWSDTEKDPHSIHVQGFWYAQVGKYLHTKNVFLCILFSLLGPLRFLVLGLINPHMDRNLFYLAKDISRDPFYRYLSRPIPYFLANLIHFAVTVGPIYYFAGWGGVLGIYITVLLMFNFGDAGDTIVHWFGKRYPNQEHKATNVMWYSFLAVGDGWHSNHHTFQESARHGMRWWQFDSAWYVISFLAKMGILTHVKVPSEEEILAMEQGTLGQLRESATDHVA